MDEGDLGSLFMAALEDPAQDTEPVRRVFATLVRSTLEYRDRVLAARGYVVTVENVRLSLDWLPFSLSTGSVPDRIGDVCRGLVETWMAALKEPRTVELRTGDPDA